MQLARLGLGATIVMYVGIPIVRIARSHVLARPCAGFTFFLWVLVLASPFVACLWIVVEAKSAIGRGVRLDRWKDAELEPLRLVLKSTWLKYVGRATAGSFALAAVLAVLLNLRMYFPLGAWYLFLFPWQMVAELRRTLDPPKVAARVSWQDASPIRSEHWGERQSA